MARTRAGGAVMCLLVLAYRPDPKRPPSHPLALLGFRPTTPKRNVLLAIAYFLVGVLGLEVLLRLVS